MSAQLSVYTDYRYMHLFVLCHFLCTYSLNILFYSTSLKLTKNGWFWVFFEPDKKYTAQNSGYHAPLTDLYAGQKLPINMEEIVATELSFISVF